MSEHDQQRRRQKRLAKQKKKRDRVSRPSKDGGSAARPPSVAKGREWPPGDCYLSTEWSTAAATVHAVLVRSHGDGRSVAAFVELDRSGPGITSLRVVGLPSTEAVVSECARLSEAEDVGFQGAPAALVAGMIVDAAEHGSLGRPRGYDEVLELLYDIDPDDADPPFGPAREQAQEQGLLSRLMGRFLG